MSETLSRTTRRSFLGVAAAGAAGVAMAGAGAPPPRESPIGEPAGRGHYRLFSEGRIGTLRLKNRLVRSAAYESGGALRSGPDKGKVTEGYLTMHRGFAEGGVGLIITGYMSVIDHEFLPGQIGALDDRLHPGAAPGGGHRPRSRQRLQDRGGDRPRRRDLGSLRVRLADEAGRQDPDHRGDRDLLHRHGRRDAPAATPASTASRSTARTTTSSTHFISPFTNRRTDRYGGSLERRVEIVREMVAKMRDRVGPDYRDPDQAQLRRRPARRRHRRARSISRPSRRWRKKSRRPASTPST